MDIQVKICGVRTPESARACVAAGANLVGLNLVPGATVLRQGLNLKGGYQRPDYRTVQIVLGHCFQSCRRNQLRDEDSGRGGEGVWMAVKPQRRPTNLRVLGPSRQVKANQGGKAVDVLRRVGLSKNGRLLLEVGIRLSLGDVGVLDA